MKSKVNYSDREGVILDSINEGVFTVDSDWKITSFNRAASIITGISSDDAIGSYCFDVFRADICESHCVLRQTMSTGKSVSGVNAEIISSSGDSIPIRISTSLLKDSSGNIIGGVETFQDLSQIYELQKELYSRYTFQNIIGKSPAMKEIFKILPAISEISSTVLIEGGSGTGKELIARAVHNLSPRKDAPFIALNCAALPENLLESELFGHKAGAFTDAVKDKPGKFQLAHGGTIFLDEIGDISPATQVRLLRVLQEKTVEPLGDIRSVPVDVRVIAATNKNLKKLAAEGLFREDLYYRIKVIYVNLPLLQERREDIPLIARSIIERLNRKMARNIQGLSPEAAAALYSYDFPGNIRELENIIEQSFVLCRGDIIKIENLPEELRSKNCDFQSIQHSYNDSISLKQLEKLHIENVLRKNRGNRTETARELDINLSTLFRKIKEMNIETPEIDGRAGRTRRKTK